MDVKKMLTYQLPVPLKRALKYTLYAAQDAIAVLTGRRLRGYPPKRLNFVGSYDFKKVGDEFLQHFKTLGGLQPTDHVLDIGCGIGRLAIPLTGYIAGGSYAGFDIDNRGIFWCQKNITPSHPRFRFTFADIQNDYYNKRGSVKAAAYAFPYPNNTFDFVFATSVFTHMLPDQVTRYVDEMARVMKPNATAFTTWFSIDESAAKNIANGTSRCPLQYTYNDVCRYSHKNVIEAELGYQETWITNELARVGCADDLRMYRGRWSGRDSGLSYQDIFVSKKRA